MSEFKVGDFVSRDGSDVQLVIETNGDDLIHVECKVPPLGGWCAIGDREWNLESRYHRVDVQTN